MLQITHWINFTCNRCNMNKYKHKIYYQFNSKLTSTAGYAEWDSFNEIGYITLSIKLWRKATYRQKKMVVIHETCHILACAEFEQKRHHDKYWKHLMCLCGLKPDLYHDIPID